MINIHRIFSNARLIKALTGVSAYEFKKLLVRFEIELNKRKLQNEHQRKPGGGKKHTLKTPLEKLFFILFYIKCYPTFDVLGFMFHVDRSQPCRWVASYLPILEAVLGKEIVLPIRKISNVQEFIALFPEVKEIFLDGTERPIQRPKDRNKQKVNYSGKKKRHTRKNILITDRTKRVLFLSSTHEGKKHDKTCATETDIFRAIPESVNVRVDLGFLGVEKEYPTLDITLPKKKPRNQELSLVDRENNKQKAKERIKIEHAICGVKRFRVTTDVFRNRRENFDDQVMLVASGLWNYHLKMFA